MTTSVLPVSNIINISIENTPSGLTTPNVNSLALFTNESPGNSNPYAIYVGASQVASDYGTNSVTAAMANAIFSQAPNILSGNGQLVIIPMLAAVSATSGKFVTPNISANLTTLKAVTNGNIKVTINSVVNNVSALNFSNATTLADIAAILQAKLPDALVTATTTQITFTSKKVGAASAVAVGAYAGGGTDLSGASYLNSGSGVATGGANSTGETIQAAVARTSGVVSYFGVITNVNLEDSAIVSAASAIQALDNMFLHHASSPGQDILGIATTISAATDTNTRILLYSTGQSDANLFKSAYAGRAFSTDFSGSNTSTTLNLKPLATISPDPGITQTYYNQAEIAGCDLYVSYAGVPSIVSTGGNDFFDNIYTNFALKFDLETAGFDFLRQTNTKVPQTESGMNGLKAAYSQVLQQYVTNGSVAPGQWNSSDTFGDPAIFLANVAARGFYVYSLPIALQAQSLRDQRKAPLVQMAIKRAGAIQTSNVIAIIEN